MHVDSSLVLGVSDLYFCLLYCQKLLVIFCGMDHLSLLMRPKSWPTSGSGVPAWLLTFEWSSYFHLFYLLRYFSSALSIVLKTLSATIIKSLIFLSLILSSILCFFFITGAAWFIKAKSKDIFVSDASGSWWGTWRLPANIPGRLWDSPQVLASQHKPYSYWSIAWILSWELSTESDKRLWISPYLLPSYNPILVIQWGNLHL